MARSIHETTRILAVSTRVVEVPGESQPERIALFACALDKGGVLTLLESFAAVQRSEAETAARSALRWGSALRQARLERVFGIRDGAERAARALLAQAGHHLRREAFRGLPSFLRSHFPTLQLDLAQPAGSPMVRVFAQRLVREAIR